MPRRRAHRTTAPDQQPQDFRQRVLPQQLAALQQEHTRLVDGVNSMWTVILLSLLPLFVYFYFIAPNSMLSKFFESIFSSIFEGYQAEASAFSIDIESQVIDALDKQIALVNNTFFAVESAWKRSLDGQGFVEVLDADGRCDYQPNVGSPALSPCDWGSRLHTFEHGSIPEVMRGSVNEFIGAVRELMTGFVLDAQARIADSIYNQMHILNLALHHAYENRRTDSEIKQALAERIFKFKGFGSLTQYENKYFDPLGLPENVKTLTTFKLVQFAHSCLVRYQIIRNIVIWRQEPEVRASFEYLMSHHFFSKSLKDGFYRFFLPFANIALWFYGPQRVLRAIAPEGLCHRRYLTQYDEPMNMQQQEEAIASYIAACKALAPAAVRNRMLAHGLQMLAVVGLVMMRKSSLPLLEQGVLVALGAILFQQMVHGFALLRFQYYFGQSLDSRLQLMEQMLTMFSAPKLSNAGELRGTYYYHARFKRFGDLTEAQVSEVVSHVLSAKGFEFDITHREVTIYKVDLMSSEQIGELRKQVIDALINREALARIAIKGDVITYRDAPLAMCIERRLGEVPPHLQQACNGLNDDHISIIWSGHAVTLQIKPSVDFGALMAMDRFQSDLHQSLVSAHRQGISHNRLSVANSKAPGKCVRRTGELKEASAAGGGAKPDAVATTAEVIHWPSGVSYDPADSDSQAVRPVSNRNGAALYLLFTREHGALPEGVMGMYQAILQNPSIVGPRGQNGIVWLKATDPAARQLSYCAKAKNNQTVWRLGLQVETAPTGETLFKASGEDFFDKTKLSR